MACGPFVEPPPYPYPPPPPPVITDYCGDGICDYDLGEDSTWCADCPFVEFCGDGVCQSDEDFITCRKDCGPIAWDRGFLPNDPGYTDPVPIDKK